MCTTVSEKYLVSMFDICNVSNSFLYGSLDEIEAAVDVAVEAGYRHFDCAWAYRTQGQLGSPDDIEAAVGVAVEAGYRHFESAWAYGTQEAIGRALEKKITEGVLDRKDVFITTKLWNTHHNPKLVLGELKDTLKQLRTSYVDMFLMHCPTGQKDQDLSGDVIFATGNSDYAYYTLEDVWKIEVLPYFLNERLVKFCLGRGMTVTSFAP
ncbi:aldo-keto reductase family 1 member B10-like [Ruditapes philippinarum]|uniref:aldo-keto reductase family 1 member B10-like n=1 Tax=Ruditapes philippinarum TaxID=129788 RepID=UPI00295B4901|nr:aldo-keto reductase family 1 member B10-like [Ruditapes philippinarum]